MAQFVLDRRRHQASWRRLLLHVDVVLVLCTLAVSALGVLMVYTATRAQLVQAGLNPHHYLDRQAVWTLLGLVAMILVASVDYRRYEGWGYAFYGLILVMLVGIFAVGRSALGAARWYQIGPVQVQPSAFGALALILAVATYCHRRRDERIGLRRLLVLLAMAGIPTLLVVKQPDLGSAIVMVVTFVAMLVVAGVRARYLVGLGILGLVGLVAVVSLGMLKSYQAARITTFLHPNTPGPAGYTLQQSKIAIGSGGVFGQGLFKAPQTNLGYVPEQYTDFIFTAVGEQLGFVGAASLLGLFALMVWRLLRAAQLAKDQYGRLLAGGVVAFIAFSVFQNVGMTMGIMPITGIPLPLVSYGGSATIAFFASIGLALNVAMRRYT